MPGATSSDYHRGAIFFALSLFQRDRINRLLVFGISYYTMQEFKSHKSLESYGWVQDLAIYKPPGGENSVVLAKVNFFTYVLVRGG